MDFSPRRPRRPPVPNLPPPPQPPPASKPPDIYSTFVIHDDENSDIDDESLPPLLKRLPKDFGGLDFDTDNHSNISGTFIVKPDHSHSTRSSRNSTLSKSANPYPRKTKIDYDEDDDHDDDDDDDDGDFGTFVVKKGSSRNSTVSQSINARNDDFGTFVVKKGRDDDLEDDDEGEEFGTFVVKKTRKEKESDSISGTVVRKTSGGSGGGSTMSRAVASMQAVGELGFGGRSRRSGGGSEEVRQLQSKMSSSSIPDCINREDPCLKYELLHELGEFC